MYNCTYIMRKTFFFIFFCLNFSISGFCQDFQWARQIKGITYDYADFANGLAVDINENTYTVGSTDSPLFDLDPTVTGTEIIDNTIINNSFRGTYLIKTDKDGNYLWGLTFALYKGNFNGNDSGYDVKIGTDGNVYILLTLSELNTSLNVMDSFIKIIKISPTGNIISTTTIKQNYGFNSNMYVYSFDLDNQNNIFLSGWFVGNISINNNPSFNLNNANGIGNYLLKINNNGNFDWVKQFNIGDNSKSEVVVRPDGNINLLINKFNDYVLYNIDNNNNSIIWQKDFTNQTQRTFHISNNGIVILGKKNYYDTIDVDPSTSVLNISGFNTSFIIFLNLNGDLIDVKQFEKPTNGDIVFTAVTTDSDGNYFFGGQFKDTIDLDPSNNIFNLTSNGYDGEAFYLKLDSNRNFDSAFKLGDENPKLSPYNNCYFIEIKGIKIVNKNNYLMGDFMWTCDFDPSTTTQYTLETLNGVTINRDGFILKLGPCDDSKVVGDINQSFCSASNPTINSINPNSSSINWYDSINSTTPLSKTTPLLDNKKYYATRKNGNCPESTERLEITAHITSSPQALLTLNPVFCLSDNAKLADIQIVGQNIKWYANLTDATNLNITTLLENGITYYVSQNVNGCESTRTPIPVIIHNTAQPTLSTSPQTFCIQQNATLSSISITGQNIKWYDALTDGILLANTTPLQNNITYYASQTINGCESGKIPVLINIQNTATPTAISSQTFCANQNPTLNIVEISGTTIKWYDSSSLGNILSDTTPLQDGKTYYATQTVNGCESPTRFGVTITLILNLPANNYEELFCDDLNDGTETVNLSSYNSSIISNTTNYNFSYYNSLSGAENETTSSKITNFTNYKLVLGDNKIYVRVNSNTPCYAVAELKFTLFSKPIINIQDIVPICENNTITIDAGAGFDSYLWSNGATTQSITVANPGNFSVTVTNNYATISCSSTKNFTVKNSNKATINSIETKDWTDNANVITIFATGNGDYEYSNDGFNYQASNQFTGLNSGKYNVLVRDKNGCGTSTDEVYLLMFPRFFTPNGDGYNDNWKIKFSDIEAGLTVKIFDRYGKIIKILNTNTDSWDGTYDGTELPATDYWFVVTRSNGVEYKGHFSLKR